MRLAWQARFTEIAIECTALLATTYARPRPVPLASVPGPSESKASAVARVPRTSGASGASGDDRGGGSKRGGTRRLRDRMAVGDRTAAGLLGAWA